MTVRRRLLPVVLIQGRDARSRTTCVLRDSAGADELCAGEDCDEPELVDPNAVERAPEERLVREATAPFVPAVEPAVLTAVEPTVEPAVLTAVVTCLAGEGAVGVAGAGSLGAWTVGVWTVGVGAGTVGVRIVVVGVRTVGVRMVVVGVRTVVVRIVGGGTVGIVVVTRGTVTVGIRTVVVEIVGTGTGRDPATAWPASNPSPTSIARPAAALIPSKLQEGRFGYGQVWARF